MTKPILHDNRSALYFNGLPMKDDGIVNLLPLDIATTTSGLSVTGTEITDLGIVDAPAPLLSGTVADEAVSAGVQAAEYTGTGLSEQVTTGAKYVEVDTGDVLVAGAWVYYEAAAATDIQIYCLGRDAAGAITQTGTASVTSVTPETWTYIQATDTVAGATTCAALVVQLEGNQSIGDKLYVGAVYLGFGNEWRFPWTPSSSFTLEFDAYIQADGDLLTSRSRTGDTERPFHIAAVNQGFTVATTTSDQFGNPDVEQTYTTATDIYRYGRWNTFRWEFNAATGQHRFYLVENGQTLLVDSGTVTGFANKFYSSHGIETVGGVDALIGAVALYDGEVIWRGLSDGRELEMLETVTGAEIDLSPDLSAGTNESFYLDTPGWINFSDATEFNSLVVNSTPELNFSTDDFTIIASYRAYSDSGVLLQTAGGGISIDFGAGSYSVTAGANSLANAVDIADGRRTNVLLERDTAGDTSFYVNDFLTADSNEAAVATNIPAADLKIGYTNAADNATFTSLVFGVLIVFKRKLEDYEKAELQDWLVSGYNKDSEPSWLRTEADLFMNSADPAQRAEWNQKSNLLNLAAAMYSQLDIRFGLRSIDGVSNPQLNENYFSIGQVEEYGQNIYENNTIPVSNDGYGAEPYVVWHQRHDDFITVPASSLRNNWVNEAFTVSMWVQFERGDLGFLSYLLSVGLVGSANNFSILYEDDVTPAVRLNFKGVYADYAARLDDKLYQLTVTHDGAGNAELFIDGVSVLTTTFATTVDSDLDLILGRAAGNNNGLSGRGGPFHLWYRQLTDSQILALYRLGPTEQDINFEESVTIGAATTHTTYNWEKI